MRYLVLSCLNEGNDNTYAKRRDETMREEKSGILHEDFFFLFFVFAFQMPKISIEMLLSQMRN